jgi:hypothetical protein
MNMEQAVEREMAKETEGFEEKLPSATSSTTNPTWPDFESIPGGHVGSQGLTA